MALLRLNMVSACLGRSVAMNIYLPSAGMGELQDIAKHGYAKKKPWKTIYLLGGIFEDESGWLYHTRLASYAEEHQFVIVMPNGEAKGYLNHGRDSFYDFLSMELPTFMENSFHVGNKKEDRIIAGLSMGGYGALIHGFSHPDFWGYIGAFSPAMDGGLWGKKKMNPIFLAEQAEKEGKKLPPCYHAIGEEDFLIEANREFIKRTKKLKCLDIETHLVPNYAHEWAFWDRQIKQFLVWLEEKVRA